MFENGSVWRPPNCTSYLGETNKEEKEEVKEVAKEEKKPQETKPSSKQSRKGLLSDRFEIYRIFMGDIGINVVYIIVVFYF